MVLRYNLFALVWACVIAFLTLISSHARTNIDFNPMDKLVHAGIYGVLSLLLVIGLKKQYAWPKIKFNAGIYAIIIAILYGILMEGFQYFIPGRSFDYLDMIANTVGGILGYLIFILIYKRY